MDTASRMKLSSPHRPALMTTVPKFIFIRSNPSYDSLNLSACYCHSVPLKPGEFRSNTLKHIILSLLLQLCPGWRKNQLSAHAGWKNSGIFLGIISPAQLYLEWEQILWTLNPHDSLSSVSAAITHCGSFSHLRDELVSHFPSSVNTLICI